jgi:hypothetical protein
MFRHRKPKVRGAIPDGAAPHAYNLAVRECHPHPLSPIPILRPPSSTSCPSFVKASGMRISGGRARTRLGPDWSRLVQTGPGRPSLPHFSTSPLLHAPISPLLHFSSLPTCEFHTSTSCPSKSGACCSGWFSPRPASTPLPRFLPLATLATAYNPSAPCHPLATRLPPA